MDFAYWSERYRTTLIDNVLPFWMNHSLDKEHGGFFTCLERDGTVYDTDKFMWLQGRQVWTFSKMYNAVETRTEWLATALHGAEFMQKYGRDANGDWYFSLTREGTALVQPYNIFSDCFATMGFAQLSIATGNNDYRTIALDTFQNILRRQDHWKGQYSKAVPGTRPLRNFSLPMILCNLVLELEPVMNPADVEERLNTCVDDVMNNFIHPDTGLVLENIAPDGSFADCFEGRLLNPGHGIEAMWFIADIAKRTNNQALIERCRDITLNIIEYSWDKEFGGLYYFLDIQGHPPQQLEWDQKLWWVHVETLVALSKFYLYTRDARCLQWLETIQEWTWNHYSDAEYGEWFGYLNRRGEILLNLKGGKWKGCFHNPRAFYQCWKTLEQCV